MNEDYLLKYYILLFFQLASKQKRNKKRQRRAVFLSLPLEAPFSFFNLFSSLLFSPVPTNFTSRRARISARFPDPVENSQPKYTQN